MVAHRAPDRNFACGKRRLTKLSLVLLGLQPATPATTTRSTEHAATLMSHQPSDSSSIQMDVTTHVSANRSTSMRLVPQAFDSLILWGREETQWGVLGRPGEGGADSRVEEYPFVKYVQLFTATGGCYKGYVQTTPTKQTACDPSYNRDMFNNNSIGMSSGLNTTAWIQDLQTILENGYIPQVVVANVPIAMSSPPAFGAFDVNAAAPDSYTEYQEYVRGLAASAVNEFGIQNVRRWRWTVCKIYKLRQICIGSVDIFIGKLIRFHFVHLLVLQTQSLTIMTGGKAGM